MPRFLAIDWDVDQLHVVAATVSGRIVTVQKAVVLPAEAIPNPANAAELGQTLRARLREAGIAPAPVLACVGRDRLILKEVRVPPVPPDEEAAVVRFQALKELTDAPDDVVIDYAPTPAREGSEHRVLAMVLRKEQLATYRDLCQAAGVPLAGLAPRSLGLAACLGAVLGTTVVTPAPEPATAAVAVVVSGERWAEFVVVRAGQLVLSRSLTPGPGLAGEVRRNLSVHDGQNPRIPVAAVYLAGSGIAELRQSLSETTETPVHPFDPFAGSEAIDLPPAARGSCAAAVGLLRGRASGELRVNFAQARVVQKPRQALSRRTAALALAGLLVSLAAAAYAVSALAAEQSEQARLKRELEDVTARLTQTREKAKVLKALEEWDAPVWLDELYDLDARIPDVNALRVTSVSAEPVPKAAKSRYVGALTIKGKLLDRVSPRRGLDALIDRFNKDGYYSVEAPRVEKDGFTLRVLVERRAPTEFTATIPAPEPARASDTGKGSR